MLRVTIWMNVPSFYQDELYRVLAASGDIDLRVIFARRLTADRAGLGWRSTTGAYAQRILPPPTAIPSAMRIAWEERDRLHIVNGIWAEPAFAAALTVLGAAGSRFAVYTEAPAPGVNRSGGKRLLRCRFGRWVAGRPGAHLLPIARFAERYYAGLGFRPEATYPFAYFRPRVGETEQRGSPASGASVEVIYVGQLIARKGLDVLLVAAAPLFAGHPGLHLTLTGDGPERGALAAQATALGIADRVTFAGVVPSDQVRRRIARADLLVLPSRWDGWGLVVNEAFSVGVPVVVSDRCGAADLVRHGVNGYVFRSADAVDLRGCLAAFLTGLPNPMMAAAARETGETVATETVAPYLVACLRHMAGELPERPLPPWRLGSPELSAG